MSNTNVDTKPVHFILNIIITICIFHINRIIRLQSDAVISPSLIKMAQKERNRFVDFNETNIKQLLEDKDSASMKRYVQKCNPI